MRNIPLLRSMKSNPEGLFMLLCLPKADGGFIMIHIVNIQKKPESVMK
jgi:hypothetical protein